VHIINDARAAAWGEYVNGAGRGCREFCFVTVSTGVGAGLILGGRLHLARNGLDGELGETRAADGRPMEAHASGTALTRVAEELGLKDARALCDAADAGDARAEAALQHAIAVLAAKLGDLSVLLGITRTAIGGGLGLRAGYLARLRQAMNALPPLYRHELVPAALGDDGGLLGVAARL
jgi:N-acylmannosamine kinase